MLGRALQDDCSHRSELRRIKLGGASRFWHCPQSINTSFIKQPLPRLHGLPCYAHGKGYFGATLASLQHSCRLQSFLYHFAQPLLHHNNILQH